MNYSKIWVTIQQISFTKLHLNTSSSKWWLFCLGLNIVDRIWLQQSKTQQAQVQMLWDAIDVHYNDVNISTGLRGIHFSELTTKVENVLSRKRSWNCLLQEWRPFCLGLNMLKTVEQTFEWWGMIFSASEVYRIRQFIMCVRGNSTGIFITKT